MKTVAAVLAVVCLLQIVSSQTFTCTAPYTNATGTKCTRCDPIFLDCQSIPRKYVSTLSGYFINSTTNATTTYCPPGSYFNKVSNNCEQLCKLGCSTCDMDYDFCTDCTDGFYWNTDFTCIPAGVGLLAASLALLAIGLIFLIISCCLVNKARK